MKETTQQQSSLNSHSFSTSSLLSSSLPNVELCLSPSSSQISLSSSLPAMTSSISSMVDANENAINCESSIYSTSLETNNYQSFNSNRHYARNTLLAVGGKAHALINSTSMMRFSINTVSKLVPGRARNYTMQQWHAYGDPILDRLDATIDEAVNAISVASSGLNTSSSSYIMCSSTDSLTLPPSFAEYRQSDDILDSTSDRLIESPCLEKDLDEPETKSSQSYSPENPECQRDINALATVPEDASSLYALYWERLKQKFINSHWYSKVDSILLQNYVVRAFTHRMVRPAEVFYNTVTEEFVSHATQEEFLEALKGRVGPAWDDRLAPLAKGFYTTAKTVSAVVGAGKFVGGALQLGKARVNRAIEDILQQWDRVLGITDEFVERLLPVLPEDTERELLQHNESHRAQEDEFTDADTEADDSDDISLGSSDESESESITSERNIKKRSCEHLSQYDVDSEDSETGEHHQEGQNITNSNLPVVSEDQVKHVRTSREIVYKFGKRLRQRIPSFPPIPSVRDVSDNVTNYSNDLKQKLIDNAWFTNVDEILLQNTFIRAVASFMRPAEHFYNTALALFTSPKFTEQVALAMPALTASGTDDIEIDSSSESNEPIDVSTSVPLLSVSTSMVDDNDSTSATAIQEPISGHANEVVSSVVLPYADLGQRAQSSSPLHRNNLTSPQSIDIDSPDFQPIVGEFVGTMRTFLGDSWDARLEPMTRSFLQAAMTVAPKSSA